MNRSGLYIFAAALVGGFLWLRCAHDPAVRAAAQVEAASHATDSLAAVVARRHQDDSIATRRALDSLARSAALRVALAERSAAARHHTDTLWADLGPVADTAQARKLAEIKTSDSTAFAADSAQIRSLQIDLASAVARVKAKDSINDLNGTVIARLTAERNQFAKQAGRRFGCVGGVSAGTTFTGGGYAGVGVTCGLRL